MPKKRQTIDDLTDDQHHKLDAVKTAVTGKRTALATVADARGDLNHAVKGAVDAGITTSNIAAVIGCSAPYVVKMYQDAT